LVGGEPIEFSLCRSQRRSLAVHVYSDQRVEVRAPADCPETMIAGFVRERMDWIRDKRRYFNDHPLVPPLSYSEGEAHPYLGVGYPLALSRSSPAGVWLAADRLWVRHRDVENPRQVAGLLDQWYRRQAARVLPQRLSDCHQRMQALRIPFPPLKIRAMRSRWGSCSSRGSVTLNLELIKYPVALIDYVVMHELCHLLEFNHGPGFWAMMDAVMPDWRERRARLKLAGCCPSADTAGDD
jgi:predicted metal-dependent hydrolase